jgi:myo-inositol-1(or 4)-monophosphatase
VTLEIDLEARLAVAASLALSSGAMARDAFKDPDARRHSFKGPQDYLTEIDGAVERQIVAGLTASFPDDGIIGEETGGDGGTAAACWVIDPIDGTANFARGLARWCVSIGLVVGDRAVLGVVYDPVHDELFLARQGQGATLNGKPIQVAPTPDASRGIVELGWNPRLGREQHLADLDHVIRSGAAIRRLGSGTLGITDVACGRSDVYFQRHIWSWDVAAALAIAAEAGAWCNDFFANDGLTRGNAVLAATPGCVAAIKPLLD